MRPPPKRKADQATTSQEPEAKAKCPPSMFFQESQGALDKRIADALITFLADSGVAFQAVGRSSFINLMKTANKRIKLKKS